ncbi:MAG: PhnD/SsuA/transferrin family substrate-binding protein [Geoalkalibacter sp.]|jgi:phosphonate transport system substrate-binding protein|uniref:PhnD/SsuA/transferrin family substrate-binding protein n=1 Tax=Geoalkalibacter sp. TaxID=3041440 RepID=UPI002A999E12|nr:PhnD/SsuA/transferrin family substrate-binding protein [Thermodesulfobacteriota bacterium]
MKDLAKRRIPENIRRLRTLLFLAVLLSPSLLFARQTLTYTPLHMVGARKVVADSRPMLDFLEERLDLEIELHYEKVNADVVRAFQQGRIDLAEIGPLPYVALRELYPQAQALLFFVEPDGSTHYTCALVTAFDGPESMTEVKKIAHIPLATTQQLSTCGPLSTGYLLHKHGVDPQTASFEILGNHEAVALAVIRGEYPLGGIKTHIARRYFSLGLRVLDETPPMPAFALVANRKTVDEETIDAIAEALLAASRDQRTEWGVARRGFVRAHDDDYRSMRRMLQETGRRAVDFLLGPSGDDGEQKGGSAADVEKGGR